jgi:hypothetical protein
MIMSDMDFSRIGELFYQNIGGATPEISLMGFLKYAVTAYRESIPSGAVDYNRNVSFSGAESKIGFSFLLNQKPILNGLQMAGAVADLGKLLKQLGGNVTAEYGDLHIDDIAEPTKTEIQKSRYSHFAKIGDLGLYFDRDPEKRDILRAAQLERDRTSLLYMPVTHLITLQRANLDDNVKQLLSFAERLTIRNSFFTGDNWKKTLGHEFCDVVQPEPGKYLWDYRMHLLNQQNIPAYMFEIFNDMFVLIKDSFDRSSYVKMSIEMVDEK